MLASFLSIVLEAAARTTGAFQLCPELLGCHGATLGEPLAWLAFGQRVTTGFAWALLGSVAVVAWLSRGISRGALAVLTLLPFLALGRAPVVATLSLLDLPLPAAVADQTAAFLTLGLLVWVLVVSEPLPRVASTVPARVAGLRVLVGGTAVLFLLVLVSGIYVRASGASWACTGFPDCGGLGALPFGRGGEVLDVHVTHRLLVYLALALAAWTTLEAHRVRRQAPVLATATRFVTLTLFLQTGLGIVGVLTGLPPIVRILHVAGATLTWFAAVLAAALAYRMPHPASTSPVMDSRTPLFAAGASAVLTAPGVAIPLTPRSSSRGPQQWSALARAYLDLTKPKVMSLLLATTLGGMFVAAGDVPPAGLIVWTLLGGALAAGGASAINHYLDRDIDPLMGGRTARRPIPTGAVPPRNVLLFGITLAIFACLAFGVFVNMLSAVLSMVGLALYVFVYTLWLKRSTPSNIVIGGAAGAVPPMVGWAAVTNEIGSLTPWYLFAIVFFWTPPHFWALALMIREHYAKAHVPMLPVVRGEDETRWQILLYSLLLVALTVVLYPIGLMGELYLAAAVVLGGALIHLAVRLWQTKAVHTARGLYAYSLLYLAALFLAMAADRMLAPVSLIR